MIRKYPATNSNQCFEGFTAVKRCGHQTKRLCQTPSVNDNPKLVLNHRLHYLYPYPQQPNEMTKSIFCLFFFTFFLSSCTPSTTTEPTYDVVIYGGTSGGIAAALQCSRMGKSVVLIEPSQRIGGLTTGGLGQTDIG